MSRPQATDASSALNRIAQIKFRIKDINCEIIDLEFEYHECVKKGGRDAENILARKERLLQEDIKLAEEENYLHNYLREEKSEALRQEMKEELRKRAQAANQANVLIVVGLVVLGGLAALFFVPGSPAQLYGKKSASKSHSGDERETEYAFAVSSAYFQNICDWQGDFGPDAEWAGNAGARYALSNIGSAYMAGRIAAINNNVNTTVQTERAQVNDGQQTLGNCFDGLQLAMPVSEALYFSGPAGPNLSYIFQLAVTNPAVSTGIDTTNTMHENSHNHGHRFTALAQQYEAILALLP